MTCETYYPRKSDVSVVAYVAWESAVFRTESSTVNLFGINFFALMIYIHKAQVIKWFKNDN